MSPESLLNLCSQYIGEIGPCIPDSCFEELPREVLERLIKYMCAETLHRLKPLIDRYKLTEISEVNWRHHLIYRFWGMDRSTWLNGTITDEFLETRSISNHQIYMNKHFSSICSWLLADHLHAVTQDPYKAFRSQIYHSHRKKPLPIVTAEDKKFDLKNIIKHVTKFSLHGRYCSQILDESYILDLLMQSVTHLEVSLVCESNIASVLKILNFFMSAGKITSVSLCQILVSEHYLLRQLLLTCAGNCDPHDSTDLMIESDSYCSDSDSANDSKTELDLLDEALIPDKPRINLNNSHHKILDFKNHKCEVSSLSFNKYDNLEMITVLADIFPSWTYLKRLSVYGMANKATDRRLIQSIIPLIQTQQLTHLCLNLLIPEAENLALVFYELIKSYSPLNISYDSSKWLEVLAITPYQSLNITDTNSRELQLFQTLQIPDVCNMAKYMKIHTGLFNGRSVGYIKLFQLLQANQILEGLDLEVFGLRTSERRMIHVISNSNWQLKRLCLQDCLSSVKIGNWINLITRKSSLSSLSLSRTFINLCKSKKLCRKFIRKLANHPNLKKLDISANNLGIKALRILKGILQGNGHIECLDITYNQISLQKIHDFLTHLNQKAIHHRLKELYIAENICDYDNVRVQHLSKEIFKMAKTFIGEGILRLTIKNGSHAMVEYEAVM